MRFEPIAVVGQACVLPGALSPEALWTAAAEGRDLTSEAPEGRWGMDDADVICDPGGDSGDSTWSRRGGYVRGFEGVFNPEGFKLPAEEIRALDPLYQWVLHTAREALAGVNNPARERTGAIFGNLSFPSGLMARYAEGVWLGDTPHPDGQPQPHPRNRFMSGLPALVLGRALGLGVDCFALDAACASSLYAIKLACDALHDRRADVMLAGAVNRADDLFIHVGFCALNALSKTGRSRPFNQGADGLIPAEGAAFVALKRLSDAEAAGDTILGVIRGVGLSNDGRGRGFLAPSEAGQVRAMRAAYEMAGMTPADITLVECHATGTPVGDATELRSMGEVFQGNTGVPIASLKSNMGHLITTAGAAGLIKVLGAIRHGKRAPTLHAETPNDALAGSPFRLVQALEDWDGPRRAGVSAFGFGGNNAHLLVEQYIPSQRGHPPSVTPAPLTGDIAVVGMAVRAGRHGTRGFASALLEGPSRPPEATDEIAIGMAGLKFPPLDLQQTLGNQLLLLSAAREAVASAPTLPPTRTSVLIGAQADPETCRYGMRWRMATWAKAWGLTDAALAQARDGVVPLLRAPGVLGTMPNIPANRLNSQFDFTGPGFTLAAEQLSGIAALNVAARSLRAGEIDAAVVGAVDLVADEPVHRSAAAALLSPAEQTPGDAAVVLILKRADDARRDGDRVLALLPPSGDCINGATATLTPTDLAPCFGVPHAASGLLAVAGAVVACRSGVVPQPGGAATPVHGPLQLNVQVTAMEGASATVRVASTPATDASAPLALPTGPQLTFSAHLPPVELPAMKSNSHNGNQVMAPAPALPSVMDTADLPPTPPPQYAAPTPAAPAAQPAAPQPAAAPQARSLAASGDPLLDAVAAQQAQLANMHRDFLSRQAEVTRRFLANREQAMASLSQVMGAPALAAPPIQAAPQPVARPVPTPPTNGTYTNGAHTSAVVAKAPAKQAPAPVVTKAVAKPITKPIAKPVAKPVAEAPVAAPVKTGGHKQPPAARPAPTGLTLSREQLLVHSSGNISEIFGPVFKDQDVYERQVRMPEPPLLLADRMVGIDAVPGSMGKGTIWTETDVLEDSWYLNQGYMPAGVMIEAGQADLMLISYLGIDLLNKSERVYRLLGCELTYHDGLPAPGDTLRYDIHVDGHAKQGEKRLFFFHYDCCVGGKPRLTVREGQAGFFTEAELAESMGILWTPETGDHKPDGEARVDAPLVDCTHDAFSAEQLAHYSEGRTFECFGPGYEFAQTHNRTPKVQGGEMLLLQQVTSYDPRGGPWKRGYLKATWDFTPDDWFFKGHFKNDPCMPGTLMFEGCLQAMSIYMAALGLTLDRDGWRFDPVSGEPFALRCRGQATPESKHLEYEIFVEEVIDGPIPILYADLLCTIDGLKAFHARRVGLRLLPDWPITSMPELLRDFRDSGEADKPVAGVKQSDGSTFRFDYASLLACAWGKPSDAFGEMYSVFDGTRRVARLPGPPYHFMTRVTSVHGEIGACKPGAVIELEYDIPPDVWYFNENGARTMPFAVLLEAALQPCGWLASAVGSALTVEKDLSFRNLDGTGNLLVDLTELSGTLRTVVKITNVSQSAGMIIESFEVECFIGDQVVYEMKTVFGFFPKIALENQVGLAITDEDKQWLPRESDYFLDLTQRPAKYCEGSARLAEPMLLMIDRVNGYWPEAGAAGLGKLRAEKDVDPAEWFFKAHFFQDPVQPGSLGIEALIQLLQFYMLDKDMHAGIEDARFEPLMLGTPMTWKYRGQVVPKNKVITSQIEITEVGSDERGPYAIAKGILWVDGRKIYSTENMGMRIVSGGLPERAPEPATEVQEEPRPFDGEERLNPAVDAWLRDHQPTWTLPALPMMSMLDRLLGPSDVPEGRVIGADNVKVHRWVTASHDAPARLKREAHGAEITLMVWRESPNPRLSRFEPALTGTLATAEGWLAPPEAWPSLTDAPPEPNPYVSGTLFHGPAFQLLTSLQIGDKGSSALLDAGLGSVPHGHWNQGLLDAATHAIPHDALHRWDKKIDPELVAYPYAIDRVRLYGPAPTEGVMRCEVRYKGLKTPRNPRFEIQLIAGGKVWAELTLTEILLPKGPIGNASPDRRRAFLRDGLPADGLGLSTTFGAGSDATTTLSPEIIKGSDWLPGTVASAYRAHRQGRALSGEALRDAVAVKDHVARLAGVHPSTVSELDGGLDDRFSAVTSHLPYSRFPLALSRDRGAVSVRSTGPEVQDFSPVQDFWETWFGVGRWPVEDIYYGLLSRFVRRVVTPAPEALAAVKGRSLLFLGNHQTGVESLLFSIIASALTETPTVTLAKMEHKHTWLGKLIAHCFSYPGVADPQVITFFDRDDRSSLPRIIGELAEEMMGPGKSVMVHVEGTRAHECRTPVQKMSSAFVDMALKVRAPIVPVRFTGGLAVEHQTDKVEFPLGCGRQDYWFGEPILPETLESLPYKDRKQLVIDAINGLGPSNEVEATLPGDAMLAKAASTWIGKTGASDEHAVLYRVLADRATESGVHPMIQSLISGARSGSLSVPGGPEGQWLAELARRLYGPKGPKIG